MPNGFNRKAFTLVELLVVMAIIGILVSLLLPAVQQVRESARRSECLNNIRQLVLATHSYEGPQRKMPPGWIERFESGTGEPDYANRYGWMTRLLPFVEADNLYRTYQVRDRYFFTVASGGLAPDDTATVLQIFTCASDTMDEINPNWGQAEFAKSNYGANAGIFILSTDFEYDAATSEVGSGELQDGRGMFGMNSKVKFRDLQRDGTSNTIIYGERGGLDSNADDPMNAVLRPIHPNVLTRIGLPSFDSGDPLALQLGSHGAAQVSQGFFSTDPADPNSFENLTGITPVTDPADYRINADTDFDDDGINAYTIGYSSAHPTGANFAFADGSARFLPETIDDIVFLNLLQRDDGNVIDKSEF